MDYQPLFNAAFTAVILLAGWVLRGISEAIKQLSIRVQRLDDDVRQMPSTYVSKTDYKSDIADMREALRRIEDKLDGKADK
jgi:hypothetical protein